MTRSETNMTYSEMNGARMKRSDLFRILAPILPSWLTVMLSLQVDLSHCSGQLDEHDSQ